VEPEDGGIDEEVTKPYRASLAQMTAIPASNEGLQDMAPKRTVLAMYPGTTTFYRAEVVAGRTRDQTPGVVRLRFEGEDEKDKEMEVERRYVLSDWSGR
jgi:SAGA-associated factor 29